MFLKPVTEAGSRFFYAEVQKFHLRPIKKLNVQFDPFHNNAKSVRYVFFFFSFKFLFCFLYFKNCLYIIKIFFFLFLIYV